jgi:hypothetical protein
MEELSTEEEIELDEYTHEDYMMELHQMLMADLKDFFDLHHIG